MRDSVIVDGNPFVACTTLENAASATSVISYLVRQNEFEMRKRWILLAWVRFLIDVHEGKGSEEEKVAAAVAAFSKIDEGEEVKGERRVVEAGGLMKCSLSGGGCQGNLGEILRWL